MHYITLQYTTAVKLSEIIGGLNLFVCYEAMAGNIIPAIATTNAIIAGLIVLEGLKILNSDFDQCRTVKCCRLQSVLTKLSLMQYVFLVWVKLVPFLFSELWFNPYIFRSF